MKRKAFLVFILVLALGLNACASAPDSGSRPTETPLQNVPVVEATSAPLDLSQPTAPSRRTPLIVFCAGSLILPFDDLEKAFEASNPDVDVMNECHGSIQVIRHVTDIRERIDVVATADHALIPMLMYAVNDPESGKPYASWYLRFAGNRLGLGYTSRSRFADEIDATNWYEIIARPGVRLGIADPRFDAAGYRALMALKLAEWHYQTPGIFNSVIKDSFRYPIRVYDEPGYSEITVPEIVEPVSGSGVVMRGSSIQLLALLESGDLDYAFEYESVLLQHGLEMVALPDEVNLGAESLAQLYQQVVVTVHFQRFASVKPEFQGEPIGYGLTVPLTAANPELGYRFISFLLGPEGRRIMEANYQPVLDPLQCDSPEKMPEMLGELCQAPVGP